MAYFGGYPGSYQTMYPQFQQPAQSAQQQNGIIWVQGEAAAKSYLVAPGSTVQLWDSEEKVIYLKSADASGMPSIKILDYTVRDNAPRTAEIQPHSDFVTRNELADIQKEIDALKAKFERGRNGGKNDGK